MVCMWTGKNDSKTQRVDADFLKGEKIPLLKQKRIRVDGALNTDRPSGKINENNDLH